MVIQEHYQEDVFMNLSEIVYDFFVVDYSKYHKACAILKSCMFYRTYQFSILVYCRKEVKNSFIFNDYGYLLI